MMDFVFVEIKSDMISLWCYIFQSTPEHRKMSPRNHLLPDTNYDSIFEIKASNVNLIYLPLAANIIKVF